MLTYSQIKGDTSNRQNWKAGNTTESSETCRTAKVTVESIPTEYTRSVRHLYTLEAEEE